LYATNHKFYGFADFFLNLPKNTGQKGLRNLGASLITKNDGWTIRGDFHLFFVDQSKDKASFAKEMDLTIKKTYNTDLDLEMGASYTLPGELWEETKRKDADYFGYLSLNYKF